MLGLERQCVRVWHHLHSKAPGHSAGCLHRLALAYAAAEGTCSVPFR
jgi:hypothetical protein